MTGRKSVSSSLRHRLTLQQENRDPDQAGGYVRTWNDVADLWAEIIPLTAGSARNYETLVTGQLQASVTHRIRLRYRNGVVPVTAAQRLVFEGRAFNIRHVINVNEEDEILEILAEEGVAA